VSRTSAPDWKPLSPLLTGPRADAARDAITTIANALRDPAVTGTDPALRSPAVGGGASGVAVFFAELAAYTGDPKDEETALAFLDVALDGAAEAPPSALLYTGTVGVGWTMAYLERSLLDGDDEPDDVEDLARQALAGAAWPSADLIRGVTGVGVYLLERLPRPTARQALDLVVERLTAMAETTANGTTWWVDPATCLPDRREAYPEGYYDTGLAHGQAGTVALLANMVVAGVESARPLLESSTAWLLAQRLPDDAGPGRYPLIVAKDDRPPNGGRLAWCYGDPGVATALLAAGRALGDETVTTEAADLARLCTQRPDDQAGIVDTPLCHGSAGLMQVFGRLAQATQDERVADAARHWFDVLLAQLAPGEHVGGVRTVRPAREDGSLYEPLGGFLEGAAGVGLALLSAISDRPGGWDALLLTRPPESVG
jgi:lantibiotic modifying enzyme